MITREPRTLFLVLLPLALRSHHLARIERPKLRLLPFSPPRAFKLSERLSDTLTIP